MGSSTTDSTSPAESSKLSTISQFISNQFNLIVTNRVISDKTNLITNLKSYAEYRKLMLWEITPLTFIVNLQEEDAELQLAKFASFFLKNIPKSKRPENAKKIASDWKNRVKQLIVNPIQEKFNKTQSAYTKPAMHTSFLSGDDYLWVFTHISI